MPNTFNAARLRSHSTLTQCVVALVGIVMTVVVGCADVTNGVLPKTSFHAKFGWKAESFFQDPQVITLCKAIEANDLAEIDRLVASGADVNAAGEGNMTPLLWAFPDNQLPRFQRMLDHGAHPNVVVTTNLNAPGAISVGDSVTHLCARTHFPGYCEAVMKSGGDPNLKDGKGHPVIHAIIMTGVPDAANRISLAIDHGADINAFGRGGATPVLLAIGWFGQYDLALLLLERGADPTICQQDDLQNAIHRVLIEERQSTLRSEAERAGLAKVRKWLEDHGYDLVTAKSDVDRWATWGQLSPAHSARLRKAELEKRRDAARSKPPFLPRQDIPILRPSIVDREGWSASRFFTTPDELQICQVISSGDKERLKALLDSGVELNRPGKSGFTVLYWAYVDDDMEAFELLLKHGADPDLRLIATFRWSENGPVEAPNQRGAKWFFEVIEGHSVFFASLFQLRPEYCIAALKYSKNVNQLHNGENLLHRFLHHGVAYTRGLRALIKAGVDLNAKGRDGCTPCHLAVDVGPSLCVELLEAGADPSVKDDYGFDVPEMLERKLGNLREWQRAEVYDPLIKWFRDHGREIPPTKPKAAKSGDQ